MYLIFNSTGALIAHPNFAQFVVDAMTHPSQPQLPSIKEISSGVVQEALRRSDGHDHYDGSIRDDHGRDFLFRVTKFNLGGQFNANILLLAAQEDFAQNVRNFQFTGLLLAIVAKRCFYSGHLDIWRPNVSIPERHYCPSSQTPDAGCARSIVSHVTH